MLLLFIIAISIPNCFSHVNLVRWMYGRPTFINGEEEVRSLPKDIQQMFTLLSEDEFRLDISSTELRKQQNVL